MITLLFKNANERAEKALMGKFPKVLIQQEERGV